jgi:Protein of unknown function (DUF3108)
MDAKLALCQAAMMLALAGACGAAETTAPLSAAARYDVFRNGWRVAVVSETFEAKDGAYRIVSESRAVGLLALVEKHTLRFVSSGVLTPSGLRPQRFEGKRSDADSRQVRADFDWQTGQLTIVHDGRTETFALPVATQDRISSMYQFMFLSREGLQRLEFPMTNGRKLDHYVYTVQPGGDLDTRLGRMATLHLVKQHRADENVAEIWLAPQYRFLPVKLLIQEEDGTRYEQVITSLELRER